MLGSLDQIERTIRRIERLAPRSGAGVRATLSFDAWLAVVRRDYVWDWPYLAYLRAILADVTNGSIKRLLVMMPPRHGKTAMVTLRYPVWRMEREPGLRVIVAAYNQTLANKFSRTSRKLAAARVGLDAARRSVEEWMTANGCWYRAVGVGGGVTGTGADLIVIDDPIKSREEAQSPSYRERVWDWYTQDLYSRLEPGGAVILIQTRWHEDDLAGRILADAGQGEWQIVKLPALAEENDPLGRNPGEALNPARYPVDELLKTRAVMGSWAFAALYQQAPMPAEGGLFQRQWFSHFLEAIPAAVDGRVRYWDKAASDGSGDYTVGVRMARQGGLFIIEDVIRGQWSSGERDAIILQTAQLDPPGTAIWGEQEPGSSGVDSARAFVRLLAGYPARADRVTGPKTTRADSLAAQAEAGNVVLLRALWNSSFLDELCAFPNGAHDDQVDGASGAFNKLNANSAAAWVAHYRKEVERNTDGRENED
jgi:predicted phage terminase large subunit-like protein